MPGIVDRDKANARFHQTAGAEDRLPKAFAILVADARVFAIEIEGICSGARGQNLNRAAVEFVHHIHRTRAVEFASKSIKPLSQRNAIFETTGFDGDGGFRLSSKRPR